MVKPTVFQTTDRMMTFMAVLGLPRKSCAFGTKFKSSRILLKTPMRSSSIQVQSRLETPKPMTTGKKKMVRKMPI